jgi:phage repressor protein C with HTH and peptisase S24 domain
MTNMMQRIDLFENDQLVREEENLQMRTELDRCHAEIKEVCRQSRESESTHASEKRLLLQDKERLVHELSESQATTQRLHEQLRNNGIDRTIVARAGRAAQRNFRFVTDD